MAARGLPGGTGRPAMRDGAGVVAVDAEHRSGDLAATGADETGQADDLAGPYGEGDVVEDAGRGQAAATSSTGSPSGAGVLGNSSPTSRPTIRATISSTLVSATGRVAM